MGGDRLTGLDASFLHLEDESSHMHVGAVLVFEGESPEYGELVQHVEERLHLVPRYRQRLAFVPLGQGRPRWADDPRFNIWYHVRHTALPSPGGEEELRALAGRVFAQPVDRDKPLWELWLVDDVAEDRFAVITKTHHAVVDGIAGVDLMSVIFDTAREPTVPPDRGPRWLPAPMPSRPQLLAEALLERAISPRELVRTAQDLATRPLGIAKRLGTSLYGMCALAWAGLRPAPPSPYNRQIGPHRRYAWVRARLDDVKAIKDALDGTVNDVVLTIVTGALRHHLVRRGEDVDGLTLRAMVPVSIRDESGRGQVGNQVAAMMAPLPVHCRAPAARFREIHAAMQKLKDSGQAVGAKVLTDLSGFAPPTILDQASRLIARQRFFNLVVTNVPGPQFPLYLQGREMQDFFPMVPLAKNNGLGVAIMSYNGRLDFGLTGDYDIVPDLHELAADFDAAIEELAEAAGVEVSRTPVGGPESRDGRPAEPAGAAGRG